MKWGLSPIVRRPREETGAGPAALSGAVRYPDRKQLEGCCCRWTQALRSAAIPGRAVRKPGLTYGSVRYYSRETHTGLLVYFVWSRQMFADVLCGAVSGRFRPAGRSDVDLQHASTRDLTRWIENAFYLKLINIVDSKFFRDKLVLLCSPVPFLDSPFFHSLSVNVRTFAPFFIWV